MDFELCRAGSELVGLAFAVAPMDDEREAILAWISDATEERDPVAALEVETKVSQVGGDIADRHGQIAAVPRAVLVEPRCLDDILRSAERVVVVAVLDVEVLQPRMK